MDAIQSGILDNIRPAVFRAAMATLIVLTSSCGGPAPLRMIEQVTKVHEEGTLLVGEIVQDLSRDEIMKRYRPADLEIAGWKESEVLDGSAVALVNFRQRQRVAFGSQVGETHVIYALIKHELYISLVSHRDRSLRPNSTASGFGGDVVTVRVVRRASTASVPSALHLIESLVETAAASGDCYYDTPRGYALFCKSLLGEGWVWDGNELVKRSFATK